MGLGTEEISGSGLPGWDLRWGWAVDSHEGSGMGLGTDEPKGSAPRRGLDGVH